MGFTTTQLPTEPDVIAPDGIAVRVLSDLRERGGLAHFELAPGATSSAVCHKTVGEIWYFLTGRGQMWRKQEAREEIVDVHPGVAVTIPLGTHFQVRALGQEPLVALGVTMPPWPGPDEAFQVDGFWSATVGDSTR
jgi:mannose-6-phosphate isomerase-like protein (cupin superfamily)